MDETTLLALIKRTSDAFWSENGLNNTNLLDAMVELRRVANPDRTFSDEGYEIINGVVEKRW
jgi:hypothetical protein